MFSAYTKNQKQAGDGAQLSVFALKGWRPQIDAHRTYVKKLGTVVHACNPSTREVETGALWPATLGFLESSRPVRNL